MQQNYGVLRVVRVQLPANATANLQERYPSGWLPEERLVHLLTQRETTIGRALNNDIILMDPTVSREHARLVLDDSGWHILNLTAQNVVRVNGTVVPYEASYPLQPQDILILGSTMLQLIAPQLSSATQHIEHPETEPALEKVTEPSRTVLWARKSQPLSAGKASDLQKSVPAVASSSPFVEERDAKPMQKKHLSASRDAEPAAQDWDDDEESVLGAGITMQFALPQRMGGRTRWLIAGGGVAILVVSAVV